MNCEERRIASRKGSIAHQAGKNFVVVRQGYLLNSFQPVVYGAFILA